MRSLLFLFGLMLTQTLFAQPELPQQRDLAQPQFTPQQLQADFAVLEKAYKTLHPGLYKYADKATIDRYFDECRVSLNRNQSLSDAYLAIMKLTAQFKCGHSYPNFFNQEGDVRAMFNQKNSLPFWFRLVENRMLVTKSADAAVPVGVEVLSINRTPVSKLISTMLPLVRADGSSTGKRLKLLELSGQGYEYFDVLHPLLFPNPTPTFALRTRNLTTGRGSVTTVNGVLHSERDAQIRKNDPTQIDSTATFRWLNPTTALLTINSLANWDNSFKFGKFYDRSVTEFNQKKGKNLVIDIRRCEGGDLWSGKQLIRHLISKPIVINEQQDSWAYVSIDSSLSPYISNEWAYQWRYRNADDFVQLPGGQYRGKKDGNGKRLDPHENHLTGRLFLLTSATNSSAGWQLASVFRDHNLATLVGQETGGNQKGITAGALFFVVLPNTKIEVDVPLIGMSYEEVAKRPDTGLMPDILVRPTVKAAVAGIDQELEAVQNLLSKQK